MSDEFEIAELLEDVFAGGTLSSERARDVMGRLMDGKLSQMQAAALLAALRTRGESVDEIVGFALAMRERAVRVPVDWAGPLIDTCGTGGDGAGTFTRTRRPLVRTLRPKRNSRPLPTSSGTARTPAPNGWRYRVSPSSVSQLVTGARTPAPKL